MEMADVDRVCLTADPHLPDPYRLVFEQINHVASSIREKFERNKEIFLPLLICSSYSSLDKIPCQNWPVKPRLFMNILPNKTNKTLTVADNGVGMTMECLVSILKCIERETPRTLDWIEGIANGRYLANSDLSGFGFYFACLVADKVVVTTKQYVWEWQVGRQFTWATTSAHNIVHGTTMTLYLKEDQHEYLDEGRLEDLIEKHSFLVRYPISLSVMKTSETCEIVYPHGEDENEEVVYPHGEDENEEVVYPHGEDENEEVDKKDEEGKVDKKEKKVKKKKKMKLTSTIEISFLKLYPQNSYF